ncbi:MAG: twin-arginine translocation pathway signal [Rhodobacterales bacterium]|nr:MAG: twin-arginine translocation pathway signal [Rhodobacterales bacterium]
MTKTSPLLSRRTLIAATGASLLTAGCTGGLGGDGPSRIDARVATTLERMYTEIPDSKRLAEQAAGMLVMPVITDASFGLGGAYGQGALLVQDVTVDYYSQAKLSFGLQAGAQQYAHVLFFMTEDALAHFRMSDGWAAGADIKYAVANEGGRFGADTIRATSPVIAVVFGQAGLIVGASLEGAKYSRIIP